MNQTAKFGNCEYPQYEELKTSKSLPNLPLFADSKSVNNGAMRVASSNSAQIIELFRLIGINDQVQGYDDPIDVPTGGPNDD